MANKKGKLKARSGVVDSTSQTPQFSVDGAEIIEVEEEKWTPIVLGWAKNILAFALLLVVFVGIIISAMASTIMVFSPLEEDSHSRTPVVRGTWSDNGGNPPVKSEAVISMTEHAPTDDWWSWVSIAWQGINSPAVVQVVSTNYDKLYISGTSEEALVVNLSNEEVNGVFKSTPALNVSDEEEAFEFNHSLKEEYLVKCVSGSCTVGTYMVIDEGQIFGEAK